MHLRQFIVFIFLNFFVIHLFGQEERHCPHVHHNHDTKRNQTLYQQFLDFKNQKRTGRVEETEYIIPIVVHVLHQGEEVGDGTNISLAQIQSQMDVLNEDFARLNADRENTLPEFADVAGSLNIRFRLVKYDPKGNPLEEEGVNRIQMDKHEWSMTELLDSIMPTTAWEQTKYYNIWTVGNIRGFLGFAQFPDSSGLAGLNDTYGKIETDGMVIDYDHFGSYEKFPAPQLESSQPFHLGRTVTHEMGHALGIFHIWGDVSNCQGNDYCADTPEVSSSSSGCPLDRDGCSSLAMVQNYMDYSHDRCMNIFTKDQVARMKFVLENSPRRRELTESARLIVAQESDIEKNIKIYPNPTQNYLRIETQNMEIQGFELLNLVGQRVLSGKIIHDGITLPNLSNGVYLLKLTTKQGELFRKIIIEK